MYSKSEEISLEKWSEMQEKTRKLQNDVRLSPEEYGALLQLLAEKELEKQHQRMNRRK